MDFLEWLKVILFGIVEGITEWLPISSTGHLILLDQLIQMKQSDAFKEMFNVVIQLGAIMAVVVLYFKRLWPFRRKVSAPKQPVFAYPSDNKVLAWCQNFMTNHFRMDRIVLWLKIAVSCLPAIIIGLPLDDWLDAHLYNSPVVASMLIIYGVAFIVIENYNKHRSPTIRTLRQFTFKDAAIIGCFQVLSLIPGTSRSGATIIGGILIGASRELAAQYTFFLAIPTMFGASLLKLFKFGFHFTGIEVGVLILGMLVAFVVSLVAIQFLMNYIKKHDFKVFGYYRIVLGALVLLAFLLR